MAPTKSTARLAILATVYLTLTVTFVLRGRAPSENANPSHAFQNPAYLLSGGIYHAVEILLNVIAVVGLWHNHVPLSGSPHLILLSVVAVTHHIFNTSLVLSEAWEKPTALYASCEIALPILNYGSSMLMFALFAARATSHSMRNAEVDGESFYQELFSLAFASRTVRGALYLPVRTDKFFAIYDPEKLGLSVSTIHGSLLQPGLQMFFWDATFVAMSTNWQEAPEHAHPPNLAHDSGIALFAALRHMLIAFIIAGELIVEVKMFTLTMTIIQVGASVFIIVLIATFLWERLSSPCTGSTCACMPLKDFHLWLAFLGNSLAVLLFHFRITPSMDVSQELHVMIIIKGVCSLALSTFSLLFLKLGNIQAHPCFAQLLGDLHFGWVFAAYLIECEHMHHFLHACNRGHGEHWCQHISVDERVFAAIFFLVAEFHLAVSHELSNIDPQHVTESDAVSFPATGSDLLPHSASQQQYTK